MNLTLRFALPVTLLAAGVVAAARPPEWLRSLTRRTPHDDPNAFRLLEPPTEASVALIRRISAKSCVIEKLRAGELTLLEAAAWFRRLNAEPLSCNDRHWERLPGATPNEKICRQVIRWVDAHLFERAPASEVAALVSRLEEELQAHLTASGGTVTLPGFDEDQ